MSTPWIDVDLPFRLRTTPEMEALNKKFIVSVDAAKRAWRNQEPAMAKMEMTDNTESIEAVLAVQDKYQWLRDHLKTDDVEKWMIQSLYRTEAEVPAELRKAFKEVIQHRFAYVKMNTFINTFHDVKQAQDEIAALKEREHTKQFCNHPACAVGVLIDVRSSENGITSRSVMLIGDVTPSGLDDGCCSSGLKDEDVIVSYCDLRSTLEEAFKCLT